MRRSTLALLSAVVALGLFAVGCDSTGSLSGGDSGTLELSMNDATTSKSLSTLSTTSSAQNSITEATVTITEVSIVPVENTSDGNSTDTGISVLSNEDFEVDLIDLQTGLDTSLAEIEIPAGTYSQIRLTTSEKASVTFDDGTQEDVMIASTGLKLDRFDPFTIESADDRAEVALSWDVQEALKGTTQGNFVITPLIEASVTVSSAGS